jgi:hypothetical protein
MFISINEFVLFSHGFLLLALILHSLTIFYMMLIHVEIQKLVRDFSRLI